MQPPIRAHRPIAFLLAAGLTLGGVAQAQDAVGTGTDNASAWSLSGFGTIGAVHSNDKHADYTSTVLKSRGAGASGSWSMDVDSRLGLQLDVAIAKRWSAVLQVVSEQGLDNTYRPHVEWANVKYQATPELALRIGRVALPMFLTAEYRKVGYVYPWVRPPVEGYGTLPFTSGDGIDANLRWNLGALRNTSQIFYGHTDQPVNPPLRVLARGVAGLANTSDWGPFSVRASVISGEVTTPLASDLFAAFDSLGPAGAAISQAYAVDHKRVSMASLGASYDPGTWFMIAETSRTHTRTLLGSTRSLYASVGWRLGMFTPYLTWSTVHALSATSSPGLPLAGLPAPLAAGVQALNAGLNDLLVTIAQQSSASAGLRWDLARNTALKLQYDRVTPHNGSRGTLINLTPDFKSGQTTNVVSVAVDFVY